MTSIDVGLSPIHQNSPAMPGLGKFIGPRQSLVSDLSGAGPASDADRVECSAPRPRRPGGQRRVLSREDGHADNLIDHQATALGYF